MHTGKSCQQSCRSDLLGTNAGMFSVQHKQIRTDCTCLKIVNFLKKPCPSGDTERCVTNRAVHLWESVLETPLSFQPAKKRSCWKDLHFFSLHRCSVPISNVSSRLLSLYRHSTFEAKKQVLNDRKHVSMFISIMVLRAKNLTKLFVFTEGQTRTLHLAVFCVIH